MKGEVPAQTSARAPLSSTIRRRLNIVVAEVPIVRTREISQSQETLARYLATAVAGIFVALGVATALAPDMVIAMSRQMVSPVGIYAAAAFRCAIGIALLLVAWKSRARAILGIIGVAFILAGCVFPFFGVDSAKARIEWEAGHFMFLRLEGVLFAWAGFVVHKLSREQ